MTGADEHQAGGVALRSLAVMFTDMAGSTEFAQKHGSRAAFDKRQRHNDLLLPLVTEHRGQLVNIIGDALLLIFDDPADAARCAVAMQKRLIEHNAAEAELPDHEIHIRAGIHHGTACVFSERGHVEIAGQAVNVAARVESCGDKRTDQILLSEAARQKLPAAEFATEQLGSFPAKGVGPLVVHRLLWQAPSVLAAATAAPEDCRAVHCLFVDPASGRGYAVPVWVKVLPDGPAGVRSRVACDAVMEAAARRGVAAAFDALRRFGFEAADPQKQGVEWWIEGTAANYQGASLGLGVAVAAAAALTGVPLDPALAFTGAVDDGRAVGVARVGSKWEALRAAGGFRKLVLPAANLADLPAEARHDPSLAVLGVDTVADAVADVLGPALGLAAGRLAAVGRKPATAPAVAIQLWVEAETQGGTRNLGVVADEETRTWYIGDRLRVCARVDRDCHLALVNVGPAGEVTVLLPNTYHPETAARAGEVVRFPALEDRFHFELQPPPGRERVIALASARPLRLTPQDFNQAGELVCAQPTTRNIAVVAEDLAADILGRSEITFDVSYRDTPAPTRGVGPRPGEEGAGDFRFIDLG